MKETKGAIIIGGHFQGLGVIRALAKNNIPTVLIDSEPNLSRFSKYITRYFKSPNIADEDQFLDFLKLLATKHDLKQWVIYPTDDETVYLLSRYHENLSRWFHLITPPWEITKYSYNKKLSYTLADKIGIRIPRTFYPDNEEDLEKIDIPFPLIIKPAVMRTFFKLTKKKVFRAVNRDELYHYYRIASSIIKCDEILIQEEIPDVSRNLYSFCPFFKDHQTKARIVAKRIRQHPMDFGQASTYAETVDIPELEVLGGKILSAMNYSGLCEVEFIRDPRDNIYKFLEVNPRIWGWHTLALIAGVNLPYMVFCDKMNMPYHSRDFKKEVKWFRLITDIPTVLSEIGKRRMSMMDYIKSMKGEKEYAVFSLNDPLPFLGEILLLPYLSIQRGF
jgi:D-aspartate ligase